MASAASWRRIRNQSRVFGYICSFLGEYEAVPLYHFTNAWVGIVCTGAINPTFNLWDDGTLPLVHLTTSACIESLPDARQDRRYRIAVEVEDARTWRAWASANLTSAAAAVLTSSSFGGDPRLWMVVERKVPQDQWIEAHTRVGSAWTRIWPSA